MSCPPASSDFRRCLKPEDLEVFVQYAMHRLDFPNEPSVSFDRKFQTVMPGVALRAVCATYETIDDLNNSSHYRSQHRIVAKFEMEDASHGQESNREVDFMLNRQMVALYHHVSDKIHTGICSAGEGDMWFSSGTPGPNMMDPMQYVYPLTHHMVLVEYRTRPIDNTTERFHAFELVIGKVPYFMESLKFMWDPLNRTRDNFLTQTGGYSFDYPELLWTRYDPDVSEHEHMRVCSVTSSHVKAFLENLSV